MERKCEACGAQVPAAAARCPACGAELARAMKLLPLAAFMLIIILVAQAYMDKPEAPVAEPAPPAEAAQR